MIELLILLFLFLVIIPFCFLTIAILLVKTIKTNYTIEECANICIGFIKTVIKSICNTSSFQINQYPVYIGYNGYDIIPQNVETCFTELSNHFDNIYFIDYNNTYKNIIVYEFRVCNPHIEDMDYLKFIELLTRISEKILITHFRKCGINTNVIRIDNFISVNLNSDVLQIAFARNDNGMCEIKNSRRNIKNIYYSSLYHDIKKELNIQWNDKKNKEDN